MPPDRPLSDVLQDILGSLQEMVRAEVRLAKVELTDDAKSVAVSSVWLVAGAVCGSAALSFGLWSSAYGLGHVMPMWGATLIVALVMAVLATVTAVTGLYKLRQVRPGPERTIATVKENLEWMKRSSR
jgi:uncharacterized membrane protein YqjE